MKVCNTCKISKPIDNFNKSKQSKDGYSLYCKECVKERKEKYKNKNYEYQKKYYETNKEKIKDKNNLYKRTHEKELSKKMKEYYESNKEKIKIYSKKYYLQKKRNMLDPSYTKEERENEFFLTIRNPGSYNKTPYSNRIVLTHQPHFYEVEKELWKDEKVRKYIYENRIKYINKRPDELSDREILRAFKISGKHYGFSHFSPYWIKTFIEEFSVSSIYDPCGGWGHRLLGAWGIDYYYNDIDKRTYEGVIRIKKEYEKYNHKKKLFFNYDSAIFSPNLEYDAVFTCPPYFDLEKYTDENTSANKFPMYEDWLNLWWRSVVKNCSPKKYFSFVISSKLSLDMGKIVEEEGYSLIKVVPLGKNKSHFSPKVNLELLLVFSKKEPLAHI